MNVQRHILLFTASFYKGFVLSLNVFLNGCNVSDAIESKVFGKRLIHVKKAYPFSHSYWFTCSFSKKDKIIYSC
ncbi:hypothetical protein JCM19047_3678 [Bacillus sp. JCM 19047]|nr:hypothetical protein JCM19047_3678 [Bacillus sp. JCM 19047]